MSSGAQRQRNEVTVNPGNPAIYKGTKGTTMTYTWRFKLVEMTPSATWCDIFQIKQHGPLGVAPYMALEAEGPTWTSTPEAGQGPHHPPVGHHEHLDRRPRDPQVRRRRVIDILLKKEDGTTVLSYSNLARRLLGHHGGLRPPEVGPVPQQARRRRRGRHPLQRDAVSSAATPAARPPAAAASLLPFELLHHHPRRPGHGQRRLQTDAGALDPVVLGVEQHAGGPARVGLRQRAAAGWCCR